MFKVKYKSDSKVERFKTIAKEREMWHRLVSPVVPLHQFKHLAYAVQKDMLIHQMDVVTACLNGILEEEICMSQPEGYIKPGDEQLVCRD